MDSVNLQDSPVLLMLLMWPKPLLKSALTTTWLFGKSILLIFSALRTIIRNICQNNNILLCFYSELVSTQTMSSIHNTGLVLIKIVLKFFTYGMNKTPIMLFIKLVSLARAGQVRILNCFSVHQHLVTTNQELNLFSSSSAGSFYPGVTINSLYRQAHQKLKIASYVGDELADKYVAGNNYLARGHLSAKTDHVFSTGQRSTFYFINAAPEWQPINAGNWNWLEQVSIFMIPLYFPNQRFVIDFNGKRQRHPLP